MVGFSPSSFGRGKLSIAAVCTSADWRNICINSGTLMKRAKRVFAIIHRDRESLKGGTMRLGAYPCVLKETSLAGRDYGQAQIMERHRHRYEFNNSYREKLSAAGLAITGPLPTANCDDVELPDHPWFLGCQFHPEFKSGPRDPHPLFRSYIRAALEFKQSHVKPGEEI